MHDVLLAEDTLPIATQITTTMMMIRAIAMMATTTGDTIKRAITMNHGKENNTNLPRHRDAPLLCTSNDRKLTLPPPVEYNLKRWLNDEYFCIQVGRSMSQSLAILGLGFGASETEIKVHYRQLARKYHPDKNDPAITGLNASEASAFFQLLNNAHKYLKDRA
jgi:hypothetical protein